MKNEIGGTCGTYGRQEGGIRGFGWETDRRDATSKNLVIWEDNIKVYLQEKATWAG